MLTRTLWNGRTIPALGFGCWAIGGPFFAGSVPLGWGDVDDRTSIAAIHRALDLGIRFFDTASNYGAGHSEVVLGEALAGHPDAIIATKFGYVSDPATRQMTGEDYSTAYIEKSVETSLKRLRRERIDLLQLHLGGLSIADAESVFDTLGRLRKAGKIDAFGWSTDTPESAAAFAGRDGFVSIQHAMNVFDPADEMIALIERAGLTSINRSPLAMGLLTGKFDHGARLPANDVRVAGLEWLTYFKDGQVAPAFAHRLAQIRDLLQSDGRSLTQGAIAWLWARSATTLPIPGVRTPQQIEENAGALHKGPLAQDVMSEIDRLLDRDKAAA
ncbi:aldo/keto reductase [Kaistia dalseonensis]|uniref:Aryl-alcohol dehydrogenase-like predicted oxidoreductase n=1 Tax=Kaistia dalseonensis TaxID=410840 RepID=A0ABU0H3C0_9HYPH|nr:aldo/keto reductase [Kaistia dalseonensis]MCX5494210.1 aldo/keto reductase [Kaistia dalseonensis]MDQ0436789.1 aryl-alcohol dehydrogenase-like predicted oxidoreductase [Kaistia dalseonensis]